MCRHPWPAYHSRRHPRQWLRQSPLARLALLALPLLLLLVLRVSSAWQPVLAATAIANATAAALPSVLVLPRQWLRWRALPLLLLLLMLLLLVLLMLVLLMLALPLLLMLPRQWLRVRVSALSAEAS